MNLSLDVFALMCHKEGDEDSLTSRTVGLGMTVGWQKKAEISTARRVATTTGGGKSEFASFRATSTTSSGKVASSSASHGMLDDFADLQRQMTSKRGEEMDDDDFEQMANTISGILKGDYVGKVANIEKPPRKSKALDVSRTIVVQLCPRRRRRRRRVNNVPVLRAVTFPRSLSPYFLPFLFYASRSSGNLILAQDSAGGGDESSSGAAVDNGGQENEVGRKCEK